MNGKLKLVALLLILPLLTMVVTSVPDADADKGDKSCSNKDKTMKGSSYSKSTKLSDKTGKKLQI